MDFSFGSKIEIKGKLKCECENTECVMSPVSHSKKQIVLKFPKRNFEDRIRNQRNWWKQKVYQNFSQINSVIAYP